MGHTTNPEIRIAKSMVDYIFRWMGIRFLAGYHEAHSNLNQPPQVPTAEDIDSQHRPAAMKAGGQTGQGGKVQESGVRGQESGTRSQEPGAGIKARSASEGVTSARSAIEGATPTRSASEGATLTRSVSEGRPANGTNGHTNGSKKVDADLLERAGAQLRVDGTGPMVRSEQFARFQLDAPSCDNCGAITVRNGNCYLCHNCGNSMGCS